VKIFVLIFIKYIPYDSEARVTNWILKRFRAVRLVRVYVINPSRDKWKEILLCLSKSIRLERKRFLCRILFCVVMQIPL